MITFFLLMPSISADAQLIVRKTEVTFTASDSLVITADHYYSKQENPYILLFHSENASRGEYDSIATRFARMRYNCLAVDLRCGEKYGFVENKTALLARTNGYSTSLKESAKDIEAAVKYAFELSGMPVILLGSSGSASLCVIEGMKNPEVKAIMAFSPGEYFKPDVSIDSLSSSIEKPVFVAANSAEVPYVKSMFEGTDEKYLDLFIPDKKVTERGAEMLMPENPEMDQYWLAVLIFVKSL